MVFGYGDGCFGDGQSLNPCTNYWGKNSSDNTYWRFDTGCSSNDTCQFQESYIYPHFMSSPDHTCWTGSKYGSGEKRSINPSSDCRHFSEKCVILGVEADRNGDIMKSDDSEMNLKAFLYETLGDGGINVCEVRDFDFTAPQNFKCDDFSFPIRKK